MSRRQVVQIPDGYGGTMWRWFVQVQPGNWTRYGNTRTRISGRVHAFVVSWYLRIFKCRPLL